MAAVLYNGGVKGADFMSSHQVGMNTVCFVNPANPSEAVLDRANNIPKLASVGPLLFVGIGSILIKRGWAGLKKAEKTHQS